MDKLRKKIFIFAIVVSVVFHLFAAAFFLKAEKFLPNGNEEFIAKLEEAKNKNKNKKDTTVIRLLDSDEKEEMFVDENPMFHSDRNVTSKGGVTKEMGYNVLSQNEDAASSRPELNPNVTAISESSEKSEKDKDIEKSTDFHEKDINISADKVTASDVSSEELNMYGAPSKTMPTKFEDSQLRASFSTDGRLIVGTQWLPYYDYYDKLVRAVRSSWGKSMPVASSLLRTDQVDALLSIDKNGKIRYEKILRGSLRGQRSFEYACKKGLEYAGSIGAPPDSLYDATAVDGKIYVPFRFIFYNDGDLPSQNYR